MQNDSTTSPARGKHPAKGCLLLFVTAALLCLTLAGAAFACLVILDPGPGGEDEKYTFSRRMERYKVAGQFIWYDFKDAVARKFSPEQVIECPAEPPSPESGPDQEP